MVGGTKKQMAAKKKNEPYKLEAWLHKDGKAFYEHHMKQLLPAAWALLVKHYPKMADKMLAAVPSRYRLENTGFTKVTVAYNNPVSACAAASAHVHVLAACGHVACACSM